MKPPEYLEKFRSSPATTDVATFLSFFDRLNQTDWRELLRDAFIESPAANEIFRPNLGDPLISVVRVTLEKLSATNQRLVAMALFQLVRDLLGASIISEENELLAIEAIRTAAVLPPEHCVHSLRSIVSTRTLPRPIQWEALRALGTFERGAEVAFWQNIPLSVWPEAAGIVLRALSRVTPARALQKISEIPAPPGSVSLEYPLRLCLRHLFAHPADVAEFHRIRESAPDWLVSAIDELLQTPEFSSLAPSETIRHALSRWAEYCQRLNGVIRYAYFDYFAGRGGDRIPNCFWDFLIEYRAHVAATEGRKPDSIRLLQVPYYSSNAIVDEAFAWQTLMVEPGYLTAGRARDKNVYEIGTVSLFGIVAPSEIRSWLETTLPGRFDLGDDSKRIYSPNLLVQEARTREGTLPLTEIYRTLRAQNVRFLVQPSTANADEIMNVLQERIERNEASPKEPGPTEISDLDAIAVALEDSAQKEKRCVAVLDWCFALKLVAVSAGKFDLYLGKYDAPVKVGYFYPTRDSEWRDHLAAVFDRAIAGNQENLSEFVGFMNSSLVEVAGHFRVESSISEASHRNYRPT